MSTKITGWPRVMILAFGGFLIGFILTLNGAFKLPLRTQTVYYPAAYELPKMPGGTSLRLAMLHDVLLERYLRHGTTWYEKRNAQSRAIIDAEKATTPPSTKLLDAMDDLAVGLENLHHSDEAAAVMQDKLALLPTIDLSNLHPIPDTGHFLDNADLYLREATYEILAAQSLSPELHQQYTARANLGTSLIHANFAKLLAHDSAALFRMQQGVQYIRNAIAINPSAHFGRETWQAIVVQHFIAAQTHPELLTHFDIVGNDLSKLDPEPHRRSWITSLHESPDWIDSHATIEERLNDRRRIQPVGVAPDWAALVNPGISDPAPFDEPTLALMGMWMLGGGPNPHAALALADIAFQMGQNEIAFDGYERALEMKDNFSPDENIRAVLTSFCITQQGRIADVEASSAPAAWIDKTRQRHQSELAWARKYQDDYHAFEAQQIATGLALDSPGFYTPFFQNRPSIASPIGHADESATRFFAPDGPADALPAGLLLGGIFMFVGALTAKPTRRSPTLC